MSINFLGHLPETCFICRTEDRYELDELAKLKEENAELIKLLYRVTAPTASALEAEDQHQAWQEAYEIGRKWLLVDK